jgi:hypothetical protein
MKYDFFAWRHQTDCSGIAKRQWRIGNNDFVQVGVSRIRYHQTVGNLVTFVSCKVVKRKLSVTLSNKNAISES